MHYIQANHAHPNTFGVLRHSEMSRLQTCDEATTFQSAPNRDIKAAEGDRELRELCSDPASFLTLCCHALQSDMEDRIEENRDC